METSGYFVKFVIENVATARATTTGQEFANFFSKNGIGTYDGQVHPLKLDVLDPDLVGFEGGFPGSTSVYIKMHDFYFFEIFFYPLQ